MTDQLSISRGDHGAKPESSNTAMVGDQVVAETGLISAIDTAIAAALQKGFRLGFEHAVEGGKEAARQVPELAGKEPLVLYFDNEADRREMVDAIHAAKPGMIAAHWPSKP